MCQLHKATYQHTSLGLKDAQQSQNTLLKDSFRPILRIQTSLLIMTCSMSHSGFPCFQSTSEVSKITGDGSSSWTGGIYRGIAVFWPMFVALFGPCLAKSLTPTDPRSQLASKTCQAQRTLLPISLPLRVFLQPILFVLQVAPHSMCPT